MWIAEQSVRLRMCAPTSPPGSRGMFSCSYFDWRAGRATPRDSWTNAGQRRVLPQGSDVCSANEREGTTVRGARFIMWKACKSHPKVLSFACGWRSECSPSTEGPVLVGFERCDALKVT